MRCKLIVNLAAGLCLLAQLLVSESSLAIDELDERRHIETEILNLVLTRNFEGLERMSSQFRENQDRTSSGLWKLTLFYSGISALARKEVAPIANLEQRALDWVKAYPDSASAHISYSLLLIGHAWQIRGGGWAFQVQPDDWKPFHEQIRKAERYLESHKTVMEADPQWFETMLNVATAQGWDIDKFTTLVNEATARHPYFYQFYFTAINYLSPKWHGNESHIETFANFAVERTQKNDGMGMYARVYWAASQTHYGQQLFTSSLANWQRMKQGIDDVLERYPDQWNINNFAQFACIAKDREKTRELLARIKGTPIISAWGSLAHYEECMTWVERGIPFDAERRQTDNRYRNHERL